MKFSGNGIDCLGHGNQPGHRKVSILEIDGICGLEHPTNALELPSLLELCNILSRFVLKFGWVVAPMNKKIHKGQWSTSEGLTEDLITGFGALRND